MIGLFFGDTDFPNIILNTIKKQKIKYLIIDLSKSRKFKKDKNSFSVSIGQFGKIIDILKKNNCKKVLFGGSLGGMQSLQWAVSYPKMVKKVGILAAAAKTSSQNIALNEVEREVIRKDGDFHGGKYLEFNKSPVKGLKAARMLGHITYLSAKNMDQRFGRKLQNTNSKIAEDIDFEIENYLQYKGGKFAESFDANSYILLTKVMDKFDIADGYDNSLEVALENIDAEVLVVSFTSDWMFPSSNGKEICLASIKANKKCSYIELEGEHGHDSFLYPNEDYQNAIKNFIESK